jgi:hypothetical protein
VIDNLAVLFGCTTVIWVVVHLARIQRREKRETGHKPGNGAH